MLSPKTDGAERASTEGAIIVTIGAGSACSVIADTRLTPSATVSWNVDTLNGSCSGDSVSTAPPIEVEPMLPLAPSSFHVQFMVPVRKPKEPEPSSVKASVAQKPTDVGPAMRTVGFGGGGRFDA